jgi:FHA domain-containing protein
MQEDLQKIDTAPIDALLEIHKEQEQLKGLLAKAEGTKGKVAEAVYARVRKDYEARLEALDAKARPLREKARAEQARLQPLHDRLRKAQEDARLDVEELKFRHEVGELKEEEFAKRRTALDEGLAQKDRDFQTADALAQRFASVVGAAVPGAPPPSAGAPEPPTAPRMKAPAEPVPPPLPSGGLPQEDPTVAAARGRATTEPQTIPGGVIEGTVMAKFATLVSLEGNPPQEYRLGPRTSLGRVRENDISIQKPSVSRKHAVIALTPEGYVITDLDSGNGTFVNDEKVKTRKLQDGDRVRLGDRGFVFKLSGR